MRTKNKGVLSIDGDGISPDAACYILKRFGEHAELRICTVYGNENNPNFRRWCEIAPQHDIQTYALTRKKAKNGADIKIVIDNINLLNRNSNISVYGLVSNDYDFMLIANEIVSHGYDVIGFGAGDASPDFRNECTWFVELHKELYSD